MFVRTSSVNKIGRLTKRKRVIQGGTSASKTFSILAILINKALKYPNLEISVVSESIPHLRRGALKDFLKIMVWVERYEEACFNRTTLTYRFPNNSYIEFFSADQPDKMRGARRNILYVNEANNISFDAYYQMAIRTSDIIYIDFNPTGEFWAHTEVIHEPDSDFIILTYKDNEALPKSIVKEIENNKLKAETSEYWANWWKVYGLGQVGTLQGAVFEFNQVDSIPTDAEFISYGLDFGFTNDPTALIEVYRYNGELYVNELIYSSGLTNSDLVAKFNELIPDKHMSMVADSAEPKSIEDIRRAGYYGVKPALKGQDSIINSIVTLKDYKLNITKTSTNLIKELRSYVWDSDKDGKRINKPIDFNNHAIDALRYVALNKLQKSVGSFDYQF